MPEVIKTILTADSSELRAEFSKASAVVAGYQAKQEAGFSKVLASYQSEIAALRLQKDGFTNLANSLRETNSLKEQAARLAVSANIPEEKALAILREKQLLQKNINTVAEQEVTARAAATAELARQQASMQALSAEAGRLAAKFQAGERAAAEAQSAAILSSTAAARQAEAARATAIANPRATGLPGGGLGLAPLTPQSLQAMDRQIASTRELRRQTLLAGQSGKNGALGFLAFSQAVEDAQYGIKGVLNNIPQMVLGFGGGAGLAGAISLAAVAAVVLYPQLKKLYGSMDNDIVKEASAEWDKLFQEGRKAAKAFEQSAIKERELTAFTAETNEILRQRLGLMNQMDGFYDGELTASRQQRDMQAEILAARLKLAEATGLGAPQAQAAIDAAGTQGLDSDLINRQKELAFIQQKVGDINERSSNLKAEADAKEIANTARLIELKRDLGDANANAEALRKAALKLDLPEFVSARPDRIASFKARDAILKEIEAIESKSQIVKDSTAKALEDAKKEIANLDAKTNLTKKETEELQRQIAVRKELLDLQSQTVAAERANSSFKALQDAKKKAADDAASAVEAGKPLIEAAGEAQKQSSAKADYQSELIALRLQLAGRKTLADKMREETELRKEALTLAAAQGISEEDALKLATQRAQLVKEITAQEEKAAIRAQKHPDWKPRSEYRGITRAGNGARDFNAGNNLKDWNPEWRNGSATRSNGRPIKSAEGSLKQEALRRRQQERETDALRNSSDPSIRIGQQSLDVQQQLLEGLKRIGVLQ